MRFIIFSLIAALFLTTFSACRRSYEDGPTISFHSREERVLNTWKAKQVLRNDYDDTHLYSHFEMTFEKGGATVGGGNYSWTIQYATDTTTPPPTTTSLWFLTSKDRQIKLNTSDPNKVLYMDIVRLYQTEMWVKYQIENDYYFVKFIS